MATLGAAEILRDVLPGTGGGGRPHGALPGPGRHAPGLSLSSGPGEESEKVSSLPVCHYTASTQENSDQSNLSQGVGRV